MARLEFFIVSEDHSIDQGTNRLSFFNVLEGIIAPGLPLLIPKCVAITLWQRENDDDAERDYQSTLRITTPDGHTRQVETNFRLKRPRHRVMNRVRGLPISQAGELRFELLLNGKHIASHVVTVEVRPDEAADPAAATH